jgi:hypothetical protein
VCMCSHHWATMARGCLLALVTLELDMKQNVYAPELHKHPWVSTPSFCPPAVPRAIQACGPSSPHMFPIISPPHCRPSRLCRQAAVTSCRAAPSKTQNFSPLFLASHQSSKCISQDSGPVLLVVSAWGSVFTEQAWLCMCLHTSRW